MSKPPPRLLFSSVLDRIQPGLELVERSMREQLASESDLVRGIGEHVLASGGKRVRPALLLPASCGAGAIRGGVTRAERRRVAEFGRELGLAFQLRDDALDYAAGERELGKLPYTDLREGKVTLPLLLTL